MRAIRDQAQLKLLQGCSLIVTAGSSIQKLLPLVPSDSTPMNNSPRDFVD